MIGFLSLKVYNSMVNINQENNTFEPYTDTFDEFSFAELKDELEEILNTSDITDDQLKDETIRPRIVKTYWRLRSEKSSADGYIVLLMGYARSRFRDLKAILDL